MQASPLLATLIKEKDDEQLNELAEYFDSSANAHWVVLFPKARLTVKEPLVVESAALKKITMNLANLICQVQSIGSCLSPNSQAAKTTYTATAAKVSNNTIPKLPKPTTPKINALRPRLVIWLEVKDGCPFYLLQDLNARLTKLSHMVQLSKVHPTTKGNLVVTTAPDISAKQLALVKTALASIVALFSKHPVPVYQDVKWSKLLINNVWTGKSTALTPYTKN